MGNNEEPYEGEPDTVAIHQNNVQDDLEDNEEDK